MTVPLIKVYIMVVILISTNTNGYRTWRCTENKCVKSEVENIEQSISIEECKVHCLQYGGLWPKPTGFFHLGNRSSQVNISNVKFEKNEFSEKISYLIGKIEKNFLNSIKRSAYVTIRGNNASTCNVIITLEIFDPNITFFTTNADESYKLLISPGSNNSKTILTEIKAKTFLGIRHALETLKQLVFYDEIHKVYKMVDEAEIEDKPAFTHRGILLDTARSYISVKNILKTLDIMAINKLNTFHWHITDSQSFPYVSLAYPELSKNGAYSDSEVYTQEDIRKIVEHAQSLGIRILPEFDAPAHVGEGWSALGDNLVTCFKWQPWREYCVEPPCGQLDPTNEKVYDVLATIYKEYIQIFNSDLIHLGGDEVNINCWNSTPTIQEWMKQHNYSTDVSGYLRLWGEYQEKVLKKLKNIKNNTYPQAILWTSTLTQPNNIGKYISFKDYIIQIWTLKTDQSIKAFIEKNFSVIFSNYDELYFDCGGPSWVGYPGQNWCSPYTGWQYVYRHSPYEILERQGIEINENTKKLVLGSESAVWTEQIDENSIHVRLWPRAAALAERLWSNPKEDWSDAQFRMNYHRERLSRKVPVEVLQPQWCYQNDGFCD